MASSFDTRLLQVDIEFKEGTVSFSSSGLPGDPAIYANGVKFGNANQNQCELRIFNLTREQRNYILTKASPLSQPNQERTPINLRFFAGRQSYGKFLLFTGQMLSCNVTQPPDIGVTLRSLTSNFFTSIIAGTSQPAMTSLQTIAQTVASSFNPPLSLNFQATDKQINNFILNGPVTDGVNKLNQIGDVNAWVDNGTLVVINSDKYKNPEPIIISEETGMVGIPQVTEQGVIATTMLNNKIELGSAVKIQSIINPSANGTYKVYKINFEIASRDQPFWYVLETSNLAYYQGTDG